MNNLKDSTVEQFRIREGDQASPEGAQFGSFVIPLQARQGRHGPPKVCRWALCWADDGGKTDWETVMIRAAHERKRARAMPCLPSLEEILLIKNLFWPPGEPVVLYLDAPVPVLAKPRGKAPAMPPHLTIDAHGKTTLQAAEARESPGGAAVS